MYLITAIEDDAPEFPEQLGTKRKFWLHIGEQRYLFKIGRPGTGENWAEKVAAELCTLLGLPHAYYELAVWKHEKGVLSPVFVPRDGRLIMGNELLGEIHTDYPTHQIRRVRDYTLGRIQALLSLDEIRLLGAAGCVDSRRLRCVHRLFVAGCLDREPGPAPRKLGYD